MKKKQPTNDPLLDEWAKAVGFNNEPSLEDLVEKFRTEQRRIENRMRRQLVLAQLILGFGITIYFGSIALSLVLSFMTLAPLLWSLTESHWTHPAYQVCLLTFAGIVGWGLTKFIVWIQTSIEGKTK